ncbi:MAG: hypothetical protein WCY58_02790 [Mariniphaga sp.]
MKKFSTLLVFGMVFFWSCISPSDFEKLKIENECLKKRIMELEADKIHLNEKFNALMVEKRVLEYNGQEISFCTESQAVQYLKDYYNFFRKNYTYRNPVIKRSSDNTFIITLEEIESTNAEATQDQWVSIVWSLQVNANGTYIFE